MASMKIETNEKYEFILSDVFSGIGIKTDQGIFGIAQRDGGIEIVKDGKIVWSSTSNVVPRPASVSAERPFTWRVQKILNRADKVAAKRGIDYLDSLHLLIALIENSGCLAESVLNAGNIKEMYDLAFHLLGAPKNADSSEHIPSAKEVAPEVEPTGVKPHDPAGLEITAEGAASLMTQDTVPDAAPGAEELLTVRKFDEEDKMPVVAASHVWEKWRRSTIDLFSYRCKLCGTVRTTENVTGICPGVDPDESFQERMQHTWGIKILGRTTVCSKCGAAWTEENMDYTCDVAVGERALTQLAGCLVAAEGNAVADNDANKGDYGWSPAFQAVKDLRAELDRIKEGYTNARNEISRRVSCTCISQGGEWAGPHLWTCPLGILYRTFDELMAPGSSTPGAELPKFRNKTGKEKR